MNKIVLIIAKGFGLGNLPFFPGTFGTLIGIIPCYLLLKLSIEFQIMYCLILVAFAFFICSKASKIIDEKDPSCIVADEFCTLPISIIGFKDPVFILTGFIFHRFFDILKPWPIKKIEKLSGGYGIVLDDFLAAIFALIINNVLILMMRVYF